MRAMLAEEDAMKYINLMEGFPMQEHHKKWWHSKTLWTNFLAFIAVLIQERTGYVIPPVWQGYGLIGINFILRWVTKEPVEWKHNGLQLPKMFVGFVLCVCLFCGCANSMKRACRDLTNATNKLNKAIVIAQAVHQEDPNLVTQGHINELVMLRDSVMNLAGTTCILENLLPEK